VNFNMAADSELGNCKLLRSNINYLHQSLQILGKNVENVQSGESRGFVEDNWRKRGETCEGVLCSVLAPWLCLAPYFSIASSAVENVGGAVMFFRRI